MASNFINKKTSKNKETTFAANYQYYFKPPVNKDTSKRYVCIEYTCAASITILNNEIIKMNGKPVNYSDDLMKESHRDGHNGVGDTKLINMEFRQNVKDRIMGEPDVPVSQIYQQEQSKVIKQTSLEIVADALPQLYEIQSGLFKHKNKSIPIIPKTIEEIEIVDEWGQCVDGSRFLAYHQKLDNIPNKPPMIIFTSNIGLTILSNG